MVPGSDLAHRGGTAWGEPVHAEPAARGKTWPLETAHGCPEAVEPPQPVQKETSFQVKMGQHVNPMVALLGCEMAKRRESGEMLGTRAHLHTFAVWLLEEAEEVVPGVPSLPINQPGPSPSRARTGPTPAKGRWAFWVFHTRGFTLVLVKPPVSTSTGRMMWVWPSPRVLCDLTVGQLNTGAAIAVVNKEPLL